MNKVVMALGILDIVESVTIVVLSVRTAFIIKAGATSIVCRSVVCVRSRILVLTVLAILSIFATRKCSNNRRAYNITSFLFFEFNRNRIDRRHIRRHIGSLERNVSFTLGWPELIIVNNRLEWYEFVFVLMEI